MGRKGAGRAGFMKANRSQLVEEEAEPVAAPQAAPAAAPAPAAPATAAPAEAQAPAPPVISTKAAAFLKDAPAGSDDDEEASGSQAGPKGGPTRGQVVQRHKREVKALKETAKKLGKKGKEEVARQEAEMQQSHAAELAALDSATGPSTAETIALADSLYSATLSGDPPSEGAGKKLTKAQKRREQRAKEDAERDARIAAENANLGETERMVEERELLNLLSPLGLAVRDIPADGHCLYRSVGEEHHTLSSRVVNALFVSCWSMGPLVALEQDKCMLLHVPPSPPSLCASSSPPFTISSVSTLQRTSFVACPTAVLRLLPPRPSPPPRPASWPCARLLHSTCELTKTTSVTLCWRATPLTGLCWRGKMPLLPTVVRWPTQRRGAGRWSCRRWRRRCTRTCRCLVWVCRCWRWGRSSRGKVPRCGCATCATPTQQVRAGKEAKKNALMSVHA